MMCAGRMQVNAALQLLTFSCRSGLPAAATSVGANSTRCSRMPTCTAQQQAACTTTALTQQPKHHKQDTLKQSIGKPGALGYTPMNTVNARGYGVLHVTTQR
jgi:hypothetical protein